MVKSFKYILKRIIIGVGIAFAIMYLKGNLLIGVYANQISPYNSLGYSADINSGYSSVVFDVPGDPWKSHGNGILRFSFGITKTGGTATDPILTPRLVRAYNGNTAYVCNFGSTTTNNSTWTGQSFSVECPMNMDSNGLTEILIAFIPFSQNSSSTFKLSIPPDMSFEVFDSTNVQVNVDTSATTGAINNQITNDNTNTQNIINNDNQNTQQIIESNKVCQMIDKNNIVATGKYLQSDGTLNSTTSYYNLGVTDFIPISSSDTLIPLSTFSFSSMSSYCFFNVNKVKVSCSAVTSLTVGEPITIPSSASYFRFTISDRNNEPQLKLCRNGNQAIADGQQQLNNSITDDTGVADSDISDLFGEFADSNTPITDLLTMPITLITAYLSGIGASCTPISLGSLYGTQITLPCINLENILGSTLWSLIDLLFSVFMFYNITQLIISAFNNLTSLKDDFNLLFAKHYNVEYHGRHEG